MDCGEAGVSAIERLKIIPAYQGCLEVEQPIVVQIAPELVADFTPQLGEGYEVHLSVRVVGGRLHSTISLASAEAAENIRFRDCIAQINFILAYFEADFLEEITSRDVSGCIGTKIYIGDGSHANDGVRFCALTRHTGAKLIPDFYYFEARGYHMDRIRVSGMRCPWDARRSEAFWRGSSTGGLVTMDTIASLPRAKLCLLGREIGHLDAKITGVVQTPDENTFFEVREWLSRNHLLSQAVDLSFFSNYKFLIDIDGNTNSWGMVQRLLLGCCILKVTSPWQQWFYNRLRPWEHYAPVATDLSDLEEVITRLRSDDHLALAIAEKGRSWAFNTYFEVEMRNAARTIASALQPF